MSRLVEIIIDAIRTGVGTGLDYGIYVGIGAFVLVLLYHFRQENDRHKPNETSEKSSLIKPSRQEKSKGIGGRLVGFLFVIVLIIFLMINYFIL